MPIQSNISTAQICAFARAYHSNVNRDKVFDDFLAYDLMGKEEYDELSEFISTAHAFKPTCEREVDTAEFIKDYLAPITLPRICFAENKLKTFAAEHGPCQYVICGAGYDTFSFRNENPNIEIFEIDHPGMQAFKRKRIEDLQWNIPNNVHFVAVDFERDDFIQMLLRSGFNPNQKTFFSILGVTYYLPLPVFAKTIANISAVSAKGSMLVFDFPDESLHRGESRSRIQGLAFMAEKLGEKMRGGYSFADLTRVLTAVQFKVEEYLTPEEIQNLFLNNESERFRAFKNIHLISVIQEENTMKEFIFTSESVTEGHPDKVCDLISDAVLDAYIAKDPVARVACETTVKNNTVMLLGEISSNAAVDIEQVVRNTIRQIGYDREELGFNADTAEILLRLDTQSPDIAAGVDRALESRHTPVSETGAGDQGMVFGYAVNETKELMPLPVSLAHKLAKRLTEARKQGILPYLRPDGKTQVSVRYQDDVPVAVDVVVVSVQHEPDVALETIHRDVIEHIVRPVIPPNLFGEDTRILVNPTGRFVIGGPVGDSGLTGRKIIVDTYGGYSRHGGGAFSGKDPTKVDRSAAYAARYIAKNIVAAGLAQKCEVQLSYAIGVAAPVSVYVNTFATGTVSEQKLVRAVESLFDLRPNGIINMLDLRRPIYQHLAAYGHIGREDVPVRWEERDAVHKLLAYFNKEEKSA